MLGKRVQIAQKLKLPGYVSSISRLVYVRQRVDAICHLAWPSPGEEEAAAMERVCSGTPVPVSVHHRLGLPTGFPVG